MAFKIKKSLLAGTSGHKKALGSQIKLNRSMDNSSQPDGRAKSSAFQLTDDDKKNKSKVEEKWEDPTTTTTVTPNDKGGEDTTVKTDQKGTKTTTTENKDLTTFKERCAKYNKTNSAAAKADGCVWAKDVVDPKDDVKTEPLSKSDTKTTSTEKKGCECASQQTYAGVKAGQMMSYPCDGPKHKACSPMPSGETPPPVTDPGPKKKCQEEKHYARRKAKCVNGSKDYKAGTWDDHHCSCDHNKKLISKIKDIKIPKIKWPKGKKNCRKRGNSITCDAINPLNKIHSSMNPK